MRIVCAALITVLAGCSTLSPQIFSDRLLESKAAPTAAPKTVDEAKVEIEQVQRRYLTAVSNLSKVQPRVSAALIGLSSFALFKALTGGSTDDIAAAGVAGSAAWAYGTTMTSRPRQLVYIEGARALSCTVTAAEPYNKDAAWLKDLGDRSRAAATLLEELRAWRDANAELVETEITRETPGRPAACASARPQCDEGAAGATGEAAEIANECKKLHSNWDRMCAQRATRIIAHTAAPEMDKGFNQAVEEMKRLERVLAGADELTGKLEMAGPKLWEQAVGIQLKVSAEVLKTEPDPTAVLATVKNLRQVAGTIGGTDFAPPAGEAQAGATIEPRALDARQRTALAQLRDLLSRSFAARIALERMLAHIDARVAAAGSALRQCEFTPPGFALTVHPAAEELQVAIGGEQQFFVSGGSGVPIGRAVGLGGAQAGSLVRDVDAGGSVRFTYRPPQGAGSGNRVSIQFTDGSGQASHFVTVVATGGSATTSDAQVPTTATAATAPSPAAAPTDPAGGSRVTRFEDLGPTDFASFELDTTATAEQFAAAVRRCQEKLGEPNPPTGAYDEQTRAAAQRGECRS